MKGRICIEIIVIQKIPSLWLQSSSLSYCGKLWGQKYTNTHIQNFFPYYLLGLYFFFCYFMFYVGLVGSWLVSISMHKKYKHLISVMMAKQNNREKYNNERTKLKIYHIALYSCLHVNFVRNNKKKHMYEFLLLNEYEKIIRLAKIAILDKRLEATTALLLSEMWIRESEFKSLLQVRISVRK